MTGRIRIVRKLQLRKRASMMRCLGLAVLLALALIPMTPCKAEKVALTFDDLPLNGTLQSGVDEVALMKRVLPLFAARKAPPIYGFINAKKLEGNPKGAAALQLWMAAGHKLGNHTYSHLDLSTNSFDAFVRDVAQNEPALLLLSANGNQPENEWRWLRYPYLHEGETLDKRNAVRAFLSERKYRIAQTTLDYEDYMWNGAYARCSDKHDTKSIEWLRASYLEVAAGFLDGQREMAKMLYGREIDHVLLLHLGAFTPEILPALFDLLKQKGFELTTLDDAQSDRAYQSNPEFVHANTGTLLEQQFDKTNTKYPPLPRKPRKELDAICR
jgi:peptidoglycan-N-acetylglucosamine deacetylase